MTALVSIVEDILHELARINGLPASSLDEDDPFPLPRMIAAGESGSIIVSRKIDEGISSVAQRIMENDPSLANRYNAAEWNRAVRGAFGPALAGAEIDGNLSEQAGAVLASVKAALHSCSAKR